MAAPTVLILAAGQGTRMRSRTPKVLHDLCGIPMLLWPVRAAREAGAERVVVVDSPARALEPLLPDGVELAVQPHRERNRRGGQRRDGGPRRLRGRRGGRRRGPLRRRAAGQRRGDRASWWRAHPRRGAAATMASTVLEDPSGYGRVVRAADGAVERVVETKRPGDATEAELADPRGQHRHLRLLGAGPAARRCRG